MVVAGGGMVGATVACALGLAGVRVAVVESRPPEPPVDADAPFALRVSAFSVASQRILTRLGVWQRIDPTRRGPFRAMRVWDEHGEVRFDGADLGVPALGHIVENARVQAALESRLAELDTVRWYRPAEVESLTLEPDVAVVGLGDARVRAALLVGADGGDSRVRTMAGIAAPGASHGQRAVVATLATARPHDETARQRFLPDGPLALLPLPGQRVSIVWSTTPEHAECLLAETAAGFATAVEAAAQGCLGAMALEGGRGAFPLRRLHASRYVGERVALVGDAAHTIHPLAGQGVNLGLLDAAVLAEVVGDVIARGRDPGRVHNLRPYERRRRPHDALMGLAMRGFDALFRARPAPIRVARGLGLDLTNRLPPLGRAFMRLAAGLDGDLPELARGPRLPELG